MAVQFPFRSYVASGYSGQPTIDDEAIAPHSRQCKLQREAILLYGASYLGDLYAESGQTLQGSFSAVSKPKFANKYSLELGSI